MALCRAAVTLAKPLGGATRKQARQTITTDEDAAGLPKSHSAEVDPIDCHIVLSRERLRFCAVTELIKNRGPVEK